MRSRRVNVKSEYRCPFCPEHQDDVFLESVLIGSPICEGCDEELFHFCAFEERPDDLLVTKVEQYTGRSWQECKVVLLREILEDWRVIDQQRPQEWLMSAPEEFNWSEEEAWEYVQDRIRWYSGLLATAEAGLKN